MEITYDTYEEGCIFNSFEATYRGKPVSISAVIRRGGEFRILYYSNLNDSRSIKSFKGTKKNPLPKLNSNLPLDGMAIMLRAYLQKTFKR